MLFDNYYKSLLDKDTDLNQVMQDTYPELPQKIPFWRAQFLPSAAKRKHNARCRELFAQCKNDYLKYSDLYCIYLGLNDGDQANDGEKRCLEQMMVASMAICIITENFIRNPIKWMRWRRRLSYFAGSGSRIGKMMAKRMKDEGNSTING